MSEIRSTGLYLHFPLQKVIRISEFRRSQAVFCCTDSLFDVWLPRKYWRKIYNFLTASIHNNVCSRKMSNGPYSQDDSQVPFQTMMDIEHVLLDSRRTFQPLSSCWRPVEVIIDSAIISIQCFEKTFLCDSGFVLIRRKYCWSWIPYMSVSENS